MPLPPLRTPGLLRIRLCGTAARDALTADLVRRAAGVSGLRVRLTGCAEHPPTDHADLGVHPVSGLENGPVDLLVGPHEGAGLVSGVLTGSAADSLPLRLLLLGVPVTAGADASADGVAAAAEVLKGWRRAVAAWAGHPSKPACAGVQDDLQAAFDDLDTPRALDVFRALVADESLPPGARFETAVWADRLLGLDLAIDVGRS